MKIATWNVNSVRARLPHLAKWLPVAGVDVLLLQETKCVDEKFPAAEFLELGYEAVFHGQPSYNGVAILSKRPLTAISRGMPQFADEQARVIAAVLPLSPASPPPHKLLLISVYIPNGQSLESEKYHYKLRFLRAFRRYLFDRKQETPLLLAGGDYNIAPADEDIYDAADWGENVLASRPERAAFAELLTAGFADAHRLFASPQKCFSWWDYRAGAYPKNRGLRIDLMLSSRELAAHCVACAPDKTPRGWERPSDHAPVVLTLAESLAAASF